MRVQALTLYCCSDRVGHSSGLRIFNRSQDLVVGARSLDSHWELTPIFRHGLLLFCQAILGLPFMGRLLLQEHPHPLPAARSLPVFLEVTSRLVECNLLTKDHRLKTF